MNPKTCLTIAIVGLVLEVLCAPVVLFGLWLPFTFLGILVAFVGVVMPFVGIALGIVAVVLGRKSRAVLAIGVLNIVIPVVFALLCVVMFSTGVWVIRFM